MALKTGRRRVTVSLKSATDVESGSELELGGASGAGEEDVGLQGVGSWGGLEGVGADRLAPEV
jgi:hypothetical protein